MFGRHLLPSEIRGAHRAHSLGCDRRVAMHGGRFGEGTGMGRIGENQGDVADVPLWPLWFEMIVQ